MTRLIAVPLVALVLAACQDAPQPTAVDTPGAPALGISRRACLPAPHGLVSWWPGDGNARDIVGPNDGTLVEGTTFAPGKVRQAFSFDGVDSFVSTGVVNIGDLQQLTIEAWVKLNAVTDGYRFVSISGATSEKAVLRHQGGGDIDFFMTIDGGLLFLNASGVLQVGVFHHLAATYDGTVMRLFSDGVEVDNRAVSGTVETSTFVTLSARDGSLDGLLDEASIYHRALNSLEIKAIFKAGAAGKCKTAPHRRKR